MNYYEIHSDVIVQIALDIEKLNRKEFHYHSYLNDNLDPDKLIEIVKRKIDAPITGEIKNKQIIFRIYE